MGNAPGKTSGKSGSGGDDQSPFGLINEEAFARVIRYLSIKDYVNLSSLNTRIVKSFGSNNSYWAHVCQAATEPSADGPAKIPLSLPKLISKMYPGKKLTINGKGIHEYDYLNVSDKNMVKNFNFREVIVKYFLRWVHFPKLETQCELYSKKTNALLIIQVADFTEKWEKYWTKKDPKTYKCATDYCYVVDFQVDPQRLEALKTTNPETKGKKLPEEINGRIVLYARSNVQPREDKFKSPINMYESFMRKENPQGQDNSAAGEMDLVFSPRAVTQSGQTPSTLSGTPNQGSTTPPTSPTGQSGLKTSGGSQPNATNNMKSPGSLKNLGQVNHASPKLPPITTVAANGTATTTAQTNGDAETTVTSPITVTVTTPTPPSTPSSTDSTTIAVGSAPHSLHAPSIMTSDVPRKKDSLPLLRTTRNWSASKPNDKQRSNSSVTLSISGETKRYSKVLDVKDPPQDEVDSTPEVHLTQYNQVQDTQPLQHSTEVVPDVEIERSDEATPELPDEVTVPEIPRIDEPEIEPEQYNDVQQTAQNEWSDVNGGAVNDVIVQQPETTVDVQPTSTGDVVATDTTTSINMNPNETEHGDDETELLYELRNARKEVERKQQQPIPQHADIDMDSTIAPFSMGQQQNMGINYNNISAPMTVQQPTPIPVHTSTPVVTPTPTPASEVQQPPKSDSPFTAASNTLTTSNDEVRPPGRRTSVSDLPLFKRYAIAGGAVKNNNGGANSSPQSSPGLARRQSQSLETTVEQKVDVEFKVEQPEVQITPVEPASEPIVEPEQSSIETGLSVLKTVKLARPSGGAAMLQHPVLNVVTPPQPTIHLTPSGNKQGGDVPLRVPSLDYPPSQPPKRQPSRPVSIDPPSRPLARPPQPSADASPTGTPPNISLGSPKMSPKLGPKQPLSRPSTPPPQPKVGVQTRPQTPPPRPPQQSTEQPSETLPSQPPKQPMQQPPQNSPPQPKISVQMRPQPKQPSQQPPQNSPPQPQNITRPLGQPMQTPPPKPQEDDRFAEPLMETFRPVPPKPWKALGVRKNDTEN